MSRVRWQLLSWQLYHAAPVTLLAAVVWLAYVLLHPLPGLFPSANASAETTSR